MNTEELKETKGPLKDVARRIEEHAKNSDQHMIDAVMLMREARRRIEDGEAGEIAWSKWARANINLSKSRLYELNHISEADDPEAELKRLREQTYERVKRHRKKKAEAARADAVRAEAPHDSHEERRILIAWVKKAPIEKVKTVLKLIKQEFGVSLPKPIKGPMRQNQQEAA